MSVDISFSWDDGAKEDLKLLDLLVRHEIPSIFFVPATNPERNVVPSHELRTIFDSGQEIGSHTYNHTDLKGLRYAESCIAIQSGREFLESVLSASIAHFAYPGGVFDAANIRAAKACVGTARTAKSMCFSKSFTFHIDTAFHFFDRGKLSLLKHGALNNPRALPWLIKLSPRYHYFDLMRAFADLLAQNPVPYNFHVWGHSWEIEQHGLWSELESFFIFVNENHKDQVKPYSAVFRS